MLGERIKSLRETSKETQSELADLLSVSKQTVSSWESDSARPSVDAVCQIARHFGCSTDYLLGLGDRSFFLETSCLTDFQQHHLLRIASEFERLNRETSVTR